MTAVLYGCGLTIPFLSKTMEPPIVAALITVTGALLLTLVNRWMNKKGWHEAIDAAIDYAERRQLSGNKVKYRNSKRRRLGTRVSIMADVYGPQRGVYLILIDRSGRIINIHRLRGWNPR
jgi:hypothetical protein